ncbi:hypothetical protein DUNSADRAFT_5252 [Dunaliella salina]|uniref:Encoded protein n=1 Tax=Dunaliella salina TaxID=3046 RepID=A0ABQ7GQN5_DUNSA|nr:hypothetical protein DUNSADRAFT_5252 [Dunaliella salina]|eukprot:KAF5836921.1 hypothetical protein DUNSADRAFT_5252 [Dunaliella salina]
MSASSLYGCHVPFLHMATAYGILLFGRLVYRMYIMIAWQNLQNIRLVGHASHCISKLTRFCNPVFSLHLNRSVAMFPTRLTCLWRPVFDFCPNSGAD